MNNDLFYFMRNERNRQFIFHKSDFVKKIDIYVTNYGTPFTTLRVNEFLNIASVLLHLEISPQFVIVWYKTSNYHLLQLEHFLLVLQKLFYSVL